MHLLGSSVNRGNTPSIEAQAPENTPPGLQKYATWPMRNSSQCLYSSSYRDKQGVRHMELYTNTNWTGSYANAYIAEAIAWSENGNHATISTTGSTAEEANVRLVGALRELNLLSKTVIEGAC
jgi:hypothetical protein